MNKEARICQKCCFKGLVPIGPVKCFCGGGRIPFMDAMIELKQKDILEYGIKLSQFKSQPAQQRASRAQAFNANTVKCPSMQFNSSYGRTEGIFPDLIAIFNAPHSCGELFHYPSQR